MESLPCVRERQEGKQPPGRSSPGEGGRGGIGCSSPVARSASRGSRWRRPFDRSPSWNSTSSSWPSSRMASTCGLGGGRQPRGGAAAAPLRPEPDPVVPPYRLRHRRLVRSRDPQAVRRTLPAGQVAERRRAHDPCRAGGHADRRRGQAALATRRATPCAKAWCWPCSPTPRP